MFSLFFHFVHFPHSNYPSHSYEMSYASRDGGKYTLGEINPSTGKRTLIRSTSTTDRYKVPYDLIPASNTHVSGLVSAYSAGGTANEDEEDNSDDTNDQSEEGDAPHATVGKREGEDGED
jgi:hypothetical protein